VVEITLALESHKWETKSSDKSPLGIISRFACENCGDEYVAMLTSNRNIDEKTDKLEVSTENVVLS
jgi:hypothetical protein